MSVLSNQELNMELEKGYKDMKAGQTKSAKKVFMNLHKNNKK